MKRRHYLFGYLFVRLAKPLALLVSLIGIGFCVLEYWQANASASASAYQPSASLHRALTNLTDSFSATEDIVRGFNSDHQLTIPDLQRPRFPAMVESNADFATVDQTLTKVDRERQLMKQSVVSRFETLVRDIEGKLRAYASVVKAASPSPAPVGSASGSASAAPSATQSRPEGSLFSSRIGGSEVSRRTLDLNSQKDFLNVLKSKAQNPENRAHLGEAVTQLEALSKLLPEQTQTATQADPNPRPVADEHPDQNPNMLPSERVAAQLEQLRGAVDQIFLTSWTLDEAFEQAADLNAVEREKCRVATLAHKGIWLSAISRILVALLVAVLGSSVILVSADLVKTFLDTASHTGVVADAINAMRGSVVIAKSQMRQPDSNGG